MRRAHFRSTGESVSVICRFLSGFWLDVHKDLSSTQDLHQEPERGRQEQGWVDMTIILFPRPVIKRKTNICIEENRFLLIVLCSCSRTPS